MLDKSTWRAGPGAVIVRRTNKGATVSDAEIVSIGRKYVVVRPADSTWREEKFTFDGHGVNDFGYAPRLWPDRVEYDIYCERMAQWSIYRKHIEALGEPPRHLTEADIAQMIDELEAPYAES